jgi:hypothetical protein
MSKFQKIIMICASIFLYLAFFKMMYQVYHRELEFSMWLLMPLVLAVIVTDKTIENIRK